MQPVRNGNERMGLDWTKIFSPSEPVFETVLRGTLVYVGLFTLIRVVMKREAGTVGMADLLMIVLIADAAQNAMANNYESVTDGFILVSTIIFWNYAFDWLAFKFPKLRPFFHPPALRLVKNGKMLFRNMRQEMITPDELMANIRQSGIDSLKDVKEAFMEPDGRISVIKDSKRREKNGGNKKDAPH
jgi:uncharacterized membrane protein YcaP (DUF421 family)